MCEKCEKKDYTKSVNLPSTEFPMRGNLPQREPETLAYWEEIDLYNSLKEKHREKLPLFCMTDLRMQTAISIWVMRLTKF